MSNDTATTAPATCARCETRIDKDGCCCAAGPTCQRCETRIDKDGCCCAVR